MTYLWYQDFTSKGGFTLQCANGGDESKLEENARTFRMQYGTFCDTLFSLKTKAWWPRETLDSILRHGNDIVIAIGELEAWVSSTSTCAATASALTSVASKDDCDNLTKSSLVPLTKDVVEDNDLIIELSSEVLRYLEKRSTFFKSTSGITLKLSHYCTKFYDEPMVFELALDTFCNRMVSVRNAFNSETMFCILRHAKKIHEAIDELKTLHHKIKTYSIRVPSNVAQYLGSHSFLAANGVTLSWGVGSFTEFNSEKQSFCMNDVTFGCEKKVAFEYGWSDNIRDPILQNSEKIDEALKEIKSILNEERCVTFTVTRDVLLYLKKHYSINERFVASNGIALSYSPTTTYHNKHFACEFHGTFTFSGKQSTLPYHLDTVAMIRDGNLILDAIIELEKHIFAKNNTAIASATTDAPPSSVSVSITPKMVTYLRENSPFLASNGIKLGHSVQTTYENKFLRVGCYFPGTTKIDIDAGTFFAKLDIASFLRDSKLILSALDEFEKHLRNTKSTLSSPITVSSNSPQQNEEKQSEVSTVATEVPHSGTEELSAAPTTVAVLDVFCHLCLKRQKIMDLLVEKIANADFEETEKYIDIFDNQVELSRGCSCQGK